MIVVIQCAAGKRPDAGRMRSADGHEVLFVADPAGAPEQSRFEHARPDDPAGTGLSWREELLKYNKAPGDNSLNLSPAWGLYANPAYATLAESLGLDRLYILSAGWGLISSTFLTPDYDITFSASAEKYKRRRKRDDYRDLNMIPGDTNEEVVFLGGKDYIGLFCELTREIQAPRAVYYNSSRLPEAPGCELRRYQTRTRTNWHYECARSLVSGMGN